MGFATFVQRLHQAFFDAFTPTLRKGGRGGYLCGGWLRDGKHRSYMSMMNTAIWFSKPYAYMRWLCTRVNNTSCPLSNKKKLFLTSDGRGGVLDIMQGRGRITTNPRVPTMPGWRSLGLHRPGRYCVRKARNAVTMRCSASRMKGELHPTKYRF